MKRINNILLAALCTMMTFSAVAKQDDLKQDLSISAKSQAGDLKNNKLSYFGNVKITQGSIKIHADEMSAVSDEKSGHKVFVAKGKPATFSQILDSGELGTASAYNIRYDSISGDLVLKGGAELDIGGSKMKAETIRYNIENQHVTAASSGDGNDRVQTIIPAENYQEARNKNKKSSSKPKTKTEKKQ
ncbi:lipopolysaccharide transport periplasmic protein LptA [Parashewanella curva]|uniref:Lipopolysaccharide transport periplasmic protein LptA n=1 Tax=Parashewanella curva TaxID=2338552 RepID=A0A3L8Q0E8_9GAMM|nr:lipopolysaccharide transport periplasmic protein LptA [Parashewanella curva]RLV60268.1 lipopolysaccharide transport periplasmic protein LptA [Parashewanella curva]